MTSPIQKTDTPRMFTSIAPRYDLLNHVLSFNIDKKWRRVLVEMSEVNSSDRVLDCATGTADVALEFARRRNVEVVGLDPSTGMLAIGQEKIARDGKREKINLLEGDALAIPCDDNTFDAATIAFGLRNLPDFAAGIAELTRVVKPGGRVLVLEFFPPRPGLFLSAYKFYLGKVLPVAGKVISGSSEAYTYLASSIETFISHDEMQQLMNGAGLRVDHRALTGGVAYIYRGIKP